MKGYVSKTIEQNPMKARAKQNGIRDKIKIIGINAVSCSEPDGEYVGVGNPPVARILTREKSKREETK